MLRIWTFLGITAATGLLLAGCAGSATAPGGAASTGQQASQAASPPPPGSCDEGKEPWRAAGAPIRGGTFNWDNQTVHLDPSAPDGRYWYHGGVYEYLVNPRTCYYTDGALVPSLAKSWDVSQDGLTWTLHLRDDVKWQNLPPVNGRKFTSADVGWTIDYVKSNATALRTFWAEVDHQEPDATTVVLKTKTPDADFLAQLAEEHNVMLAHEVKEQLGDFKAAQVGTGAFQLKEFHPQQEVIWERNPGYYKMGADGKPLPYLDQIHQFYFADQATSVAAFRSGQIDRNANGGFLSVKDADEVAQALPKAKRFNNPAANVYMVWMKDGSAPWNDVRVRQAVSLAIDREDLIAVQNGGAVQQGWIPSAVAGDFGWSEEKIKSTFKPDLAKAKQLLAEAGFTPNSTPFIFKSGASYQQFMEVIQQQLQPLGFNIKIEIGSGSAVTPIIAKRDFDMAYGPYGGGRLPSFWLGDLLHTGGAQNISGYADPKLDALIDAQTKEIDPVKRKAVLGQIQDYLTENMPYVPTITRIYYHFDACRVRNMRPQHNSAAMWGIQEAWLDPTGC